MKLELEGELRVWRDYEEGPTLYVGGKPLLVWIDPPEDYGEFDVTYDAQCWAGAAPIPGQWRIVIEQLEGGDGQ